MEERVIFSVKNGKYYDKENKEYDILYCQIKTVCKGTYGEEPRPFIIEWKDFKQKALDFEKEIHISDLEHNEKGIKIMGFSIPWTNQFFLKQLVELGILK